MDWWRKRVRLRRIQQVQEAQDKKKVLAGQLVGRIIVKRKAKLPPKKFPVLPKKRKAIPAMELFFNDFIPKIKELRNEVPKVPERVFDNGRAFIARLEVKGWTSLGSGAFSTVLAKGDSKRVIKVTRRPDGWINYIKWANDNGYAGKFAPKVFSYKYIKGKDNLDFSISSMERLPNTLGHLKYSHSAHVVESLLHTAANDNELAGTLLDLVQPGIKEFNQKLRDKFGHLDLHHGNFMVRDSGELVFTDPVSSVDDDVLKDRLKFAA